MDERGVGDIEFDEIGRRELRRVRLAYFTELSNAGMDAIGTVWRRSRF